MKQNMSNFLNNIIITSKEKEIFENITKLGDLTEKSETKKDFEEVLKYLKSGRQFHFELPKLLISAAAFMLPISALFFTNFGPWISKATPFILDFLFLVLFILIYSTPSSVEKRIIIKDTLLDNDINEISTDNKKSKKTLKGTLEQYFGNKGTVTIVKAYKAKWESDDLNCNYYINFSKHLISEEYQDNKGNTKRRDTPRFRNIISCDLDIEIPELIIYENNFLNKMKNGLNLLDNMAVDKRYADKNVYWKKFMTDKGYHKMSKVFGITNLDKKVACYTNDEKSLLKLLKPSVKKSIESIFEKYPQVILCTYGKTIQIGHLTNHPDGIFESEKETSIKSPVEFANEIAKQDSAEVVEDLMGMITDIKRMNDSNF